MSTSPAQHVRMYPNDGVVAALENVLSFDSFDGQLRATVADIFRKHGIPVSGSSASRGTPVVALQIAQPLPKPLKTGSWAVAGVPTYCK